MISKPGSYSDLRQSAPTQWATKPTTKEAETALRFLVRQSEAATLTAVQIRHIAETLGLLPARRGRIWDPETQGFVSFVRERRTTKFGQVHA